VIVTKKNQKLNDNELIIDNWRKIIKYMYVLLKDDE